MTAIGDQSDRDASLELACQSPDEFVRQLVQAHYQDVYRFAYRLSGTSADAEDLAQHAFLTACRKLKQLRNASRARAWLFTIVRHQYLKSRTHKEDAAADEILTSLPDSAHERETAFDQEQLTQALRELPESFRSVVLLFYMEDFSYQEIADMLQIPIGTVMSRLARGKQALRARLQSERSSQLSESRVED